MKNYFKHILYILFFFLLQTGKAINIDSDSTDIKSKIAEGTKKLLALHDKNQEYLIKGEFNKLNFILDLNDHVKDNIVNGSASFLTDASLKQKLNDSLVSIYTKFQLSTYLILSNYYETKITAKLPGDAETININDLMGESKWFAKNSDITTINQKNYSITKGIATEIAQTTSVNFLIVNLSIWKIQYLENKGASYYSYLLYQNIPNSNIPTAVSTMQFRSNVENAFNNESWQTSNPNIFAQTAINKICRSARNVGLRQQLLFTTNTSELNDILNQFNNTDYYALNSKERLHALRVFIRGNYDESKANKLIGIISSQFIPEFYDSLKLNIQVSNTNGKYINFIIDKTSGNDLDDLFHYFAKNFIYYYKAKASQYSSESSYEIINVAPNFIDIGDCSILQADVNSNGTIQLKYRVVTDVVEHFIPRPTSDNTNVVLNPPPPNSDLPSNSDDYILHPDNYIVTNDIITQDFPENSQVDIYQPVFISYDGEDEDINKTLGPSRSALVPALYLYYLNNEQEKANLQENITNTISITVQVVAVALTDGAALPLLNGTKYATLAVNVYKAANYLSIGLNTTAWVTSDPDIINLRNKVDAILLVVDLPSTVKSLPNAWRNVRTFSKNSINSIKAVSKTSANEFYLALKQCGGKINSLPAATKKQILKLYYKLKRANLIDEVASVVGLASHVDMQESLAIINQLKNQNKFTKIIGSLSDIELAAIHKYTVNGNVILDKMRNGNEIIVDIVSFNTFELQLYQTLKNALYKLQATNRLVTTNVIRGRTYSLADFNTLFKSGKANVPLKGMVSCTKDEAVAIDFLSSSGANISGTKVKVIMKIKSKNGIDIDDISEWGINRCSSNPACTRIQKEVLLDEGLFKQIGIPTAYKENGVPKIDSDGTEWFVVELEELGTPFRTIN